MTLAWPPSLRVKRSALMHCGRLIALLRKLVQHLWGASTLNCLSTVCVTYYCCYLMIRSIPIGFTILLWRPVMNVSLLLRIKYTCWTIIYTRTKTTPSLSEPQCGWATKRSVVLRMHTIHEPKKELDVDYQSATEEEPKHPANAII